MAINLFMSRLSTKVANYCIALLVVTLVVLPSIITLCWLLTLILVTLITCIVIRRVPLLVWWLIALFSPIGIGIIIPIILWASVLVLVGV
jgi:hypothetical protein